MRQRMCSRVSACDGAARTGDHDPTAGHDLPRVLVLEIHGLTAQEVLRRNVLHLGEMDVAQDDVPQSGHDAEGQAGPLAEDDQERSVISRLTLDPGFDAKNAQKVLHDCMRKIARRKVDREIADAEYSGDLKRLNELLGLRKKLLQETSG